MRSSWKTLVAAVASLLVAPQLVTADDGVQEQLRQMQERMSQLEDKLQATDDQLRSANQRVEEQEKLLDRSGLGDEQSGISGLSRFLSQTEFGGWVAGSYFYNTNNPSRRNQAGGNLGNGFASNAFHPDSNSFQLDQLWFSMKKEATSDSRAGFGADVLFGKTADLLTFGATANGDLTNVYQAYVEYLAPVGSGVRIAAGRFATHIGAEVAQTTQNFNITRGMVYTLLQPFNHVGVYGSMDLGGGLDLGLGVSNTAFSNLNTDTDDEKTLLWHVGYAAETMAIAVNGLWGGDTGFGAVPGAVGGAGINRDKLGIVDVVLSWDPSDNLSTWLNFDYVWEEDSRFGAGARPNPEAYAVALAGRLALSDQTGFAIRGEYIRSIDGAVFGGASRVHEDLWSVTGTLDHALTDNLTLRGEVRYDEGERENGPDTFFVDGNGLAGGDFKDEQVLVGAEIIYEF